MRRKVKSGRKKGARGKNDPGSDSEYEETEKGSWESRERVESQEIAVARRLYVEEAAGEGRALLAPPEKEAWAQEHAVETYSTTDRRGPLGDFVGAALTDVRDRGTRREERTLRTGEELEVMGEACVRDGSLVLREPDKSSEPCLHRMSSLQLGQEDNGERSGLSGKLFVATVLRGATRSLVEAHRGRAWWLRIGKWLLGVLAALLAAFAAGGLRARLRNGRLILDSPVTSRWRRL